MKGTWRHLQTFWSKWRIPRAVQSALKPSRLFLPVLGKSLKKEISFIDLLKVFLFAGLRRGGKKQTKQTFCWSLLWKLSYCLLQIFLKSCFFFFVSKILSYFNGVKRSTFKKTHWKLSAGNKMGAVVFARLGDKHVDTTVWLKQACSNFLTPLRILITYQVREHNSEVFSWENFIFYIWSVSWNTGCAVFFLYPGD